MAEFDLSGKVALVTGGGSGIGFAMAQAMAGAGATVAIAGRDRARGEAAAALIGGGARYQQLDTADPDSCAAALDAVVAGCGGIDILVNNAGMSIGKPPQDLSLDEWRQIMDVNLTGAFLLSQRAYPEMCRRGGGKIINVGSITTLFGSAVAAAYGASKGGIGQLTKALAVSWAVDNIQVNAILPGYVATALTTAAMRERPDLHDRVVARTPARRLGRPEDFGGIAVFLASAASDFITGAIIPVDGGYMSQA
ncbi:SDR family NAD(P)-dependent oxidoreductase [Rhizorhabdus dicambivorans]|uniref:3-oxoacyl-ACP reductase n=1 Tax=Rhizorhabdus dicambivorans TaxID=1850238 RepID=A0A2A4FQQ9_9SPHN|nr:glucose 1-dehydrogenase [Rhizorhabdus dicambivorans]ATE66414.1 3-oxoacyl-ACP reductase [Rhizorhabdus dicambivorans]PCE41095.1 3-oxoacyl-ACP reductase [Rhizorhabdus dicambivorans]